MAPQLLIFTGAPEASSLNWQEQGISESFSGAIARFIGLAGPDSVQQIIPATPDVTPTAAAHPSWRSLPLERQHLTTGLTQSSDRHRLFIGNSQPKDSQGATFFTTSQLSSCIEDFAQAPESHPSSIQSASELLSQFYEESYARHEDVQSSQIAPASESGTSFTSDEFSSSSFNSPLRPFGATKDIPISGHLSNLKGLPNATYLNSIHPQTMTINIIVGIISILEPRGIKTKRGDGVELIEVIVGDETSSGFGVNFWLSSLQAQGDMKKVLSGLRPRDVVLMRNVALSSFRGKVYGQSLRKEMTKVHLLYRNRVDKSDIGGCYSAADLAMGEAAIPQVEKTRRVREWVLKFVGMGTGHQNRKGRTTDVAKEILPPDTQ